MFRKTAIVHRDRYAKTVSAILSALLLTSCSSGTMDPRLLGGQAGPSVQKTGVTTPQATRGMFAVTDVGTASRGGGGACVYASFSGKGTATFRGSFLATFHETGGAENLPSQGRCVPTEWTGSATFVDTVAKRNTLNARLHGGSCAMALPCTLSWYVHGGTGKFGSASGQGTMTIEGWRPYSDEWRGVLTY
jgi:hypothetical protein